MEVIRPIRNPRPPRAIADLAAGLILIPCVMVAMRDAVLGRGAVMWWGYPLGFLVQLFFGMIAVWAALQIWPKLNIGTFWPALLRVAAIHAAFDAIHPLARDHPLTGAVVQGVVAIGLFLLLFRLRGVPGLGSAVIVYFMKVITAMMVMETVYTMM
jgi:hypothetical protein